MTMLTLFQLKAGDRFYFVGDPKKTVREVKQLIYRRQLSNYPQYVIFKDFTEGHSDRHVILLRNINDK